MLVIGSFGNETPEQHQMAVGYLRKGSNIDFANDENAKMVSIDNICCRSYLYDQIAIDPDSKTHIFAAPNEIENSFIELKANTQQLSQS